MVFRERNILKKYHANEVLIGTITPEQYQKAYSFYERLQYKDIQAKPYKIKWKFKDSDGNTHQGNDWNIEMFKKLK